MSIELFLDETCEECRNSEFTLRRGIVINRGKFENEMLETYHAYHIMLDGFSDDSMIADGLEIVRCGQTFIEFADLGFVIGQHFDSEALADQAWEALEAEYSAYPEEESDDMPDDQALEHDQDYGRPESDSSYWPNPEGWRFVDTGA